MVSVKELLTLPQSSEYFRRFSRDGSDIKLDRIDLILLCGWERAFFLEKTVANGDSTIVLRYQKEKGVLFSFYSDLQQLEITQFQAVSGRAGYRLTTDLRLAHLFADQIESIVSHNRANFERICMPPIEEIQGLLESDSAIAFGRYKSLTSILGMSYSNEERLFIRDIKRDQPTCL